MSTEPAPDPVTVEVLKFDIPALFDLRPEAGIDGEFLWPYPPLALAMLYGASAEHSRAIQIKAEGAYGNGFLGKGAGRLAEVCDDGALGTFISLGLDLECYGNAFLQVIRSRDGKRLIGLRRLPAITMARYRAGFLQRVAQPEGGVKKITFGPEEIVHLREPCAFGGRYARPTWISAEGMLKLTRAAVAYNAAFFENSAIPEYAVIFKGMTPTPEQKSQIGDFFRGEYRGIHNAHRTLVLSTTEDGEIKFERLTADVKDGDFLKLIDAARDRIPVAHGVPPRMLGIVSAGQLGGGGEVAGQMFTFESLTLRPRRRRVMDQLRPVLSMLGLRPGDPDVGLADDEIAFRPLDLTPPGDDTDKLADWVTAGIIGPEEARLFLPGFETSGSGGPSPVARSADLSAIDQLAAMLARF